MQKGVAKMAELGKNIVHFPRKKLTTQKKSSVVHLILDTGI